MNIEILRIYEDYITTIFTLACSSWWHQIFETYRRNVKRRTECVSEEVLHVCGEERWHTVSLQKFN